MVPCQARALLQSILKTAGTGRRRPGLSPHPETEVSGKHKNKIEKIHKLVDVYNAIHKRWG